MAVSLDRHNDGPFTRSGTLAEVGVSGGVAPREIHKEVQWADWGPGGKDLAIVRDVNLRNQLEFPAGKMLYQTAGWISHPRVSPDGNHVAFLDHPQRGDDGGWSRSSTGREKRPRSPESSRRSTASHGRRAGRRSGSRGRKSAAIARFTPSLDGAERLLARVTQSLTLQDVSRDGRVLVAHDSIRIGILAGKEGQPKEKELAWLDWSLAFRPFE